LQETDDAYVGGDVTVIGSKVSGYITEVLVTDNQAVRAGDVLARIDDRDYRAVLAKAEGAIAAQQALLANLEATQRLQEAVIGQARASVAATDAEPGAHTTTRCATQAWSPRKRCRCRVRRRPMPTTSSRAPMATRRRPR
jgi:multidrug resistance efflux pump